MAQSLHQGCFSLVWRCCRAIFQLVENRWWIEGRQRRIRPVCHSKRQNVRSKAVRSIRTERDMPERFRRRLKRGFRADANAFLEAVADEGRRRVAPVKRHVPNVYFQFLHLALFCPYEAQKGENCWSLNGLCVAALWPNCFCFRRIPYFWHEFGLFLSGKGKIFGLIPVYLRPHCGQTCSAVYGAVQQARRALQGNFRKNEA